MGCWLHLAFGPDFPRASQNRNGPRESIAIAVDSKPQAAEQLSRASAAHILAAPDHAATADETGSHAAPSDLEDDPDHGPERSRTK